MSQPAYRPPVKPTRLEELLEREVTSAKRRSPLDELLEEEELELIREAKKAKIEEILLERELKKLEKEKRLRELKRELGISDSGSNKPNLGLGLDDSTIKYLMSLPEEKRREAIRLIAMVRAAESGGNAAALVPILMMSQGKGGQSDVTAVVLAEVLKALIEMLKSRGGESDTVARLVKELEEARAKILEKEIEDLKSTVKFDPVGYLTSTLKQLQEAGLVKVGDGGGSASSPLVQLKLKELEYKMQAYMKKLETEYLEKMYKMQKEMAEFLHKLRKEEEKDKMDKEFAMKQMEVFGNTLGKAIEQIGGPIGELLGQFIGDALMKMGQQKRAAGGGSGEGK